MSVEGVASRGCIAAFTLALLGACTSQEQLYPELTDGAETGAGGSDPSNGGAPSDGVDAAAPMAPPPITVEMVSIGARADAAPDNIDTTGGTIVLRDGTVISWGVGGTMGDARGFSVATVDATGMLAAPVATFDTYHTSDTDQTEAARLNDYLDALAAGTIVLIGVADDAGITHGTSPEETPSRNCEPLTDPTTVALRERLVVLGSTLLDSYCFRDSWALATIVGLGVALDEAHGQDDPASVRIELDP